MRHRIALWKAVEKHLSLPHRLPTLAKDARMGPALSVNDSHGKAPTVHNSVEERRHKLGARTTAFDVLSNEEARDMFRAFFVYVVFSATLAFGQVANGASTPTQTTPSLSFERGLRKAVAFLQLDCHQGDKHFTVRGTGFFVTVPDKRLDGKAFTYLVTNRHVAMCWNDDLQPMQILSTSMRLNRKDGSAPLLTPSGSPLWFFPSDESVDLAIVGYAPDEQIYDFMTIPYDALMTDEKTLSEGMQVIFSGYFYQLPGEKRIEPIIREGILAMIPDEEILTTTKKRGKVYLCDVHTFHGNSGSPVFVDVGGLRRGCSDRNTKCLVSSAEDTTKMKTSI